MRRRTLSEDWDGSIGYAYRAHPDNVLDGPTGKKICPRITKASESLRRQDGCRLFAAGSIHADLLVDASAALQRIGAGILRQRRRLDSLRLGQRHVRDERMGEGPGSAEHRPDPGWQR